MRFDDVEERLAVLPDPLPAPLDALMPVPLDGVERRFRLPTESTPGRPAAVLVLLYPDTTGETRVVLIERPTVGRPSSLRGGELPRWQGGARG